MDLRVQMILGWFSMWDVRGGVAGLNSDALCSLPTMYGSKSDRDFCDMRWGVKMCAGWGWLALWEKQLVRYWLLCPSCKERNCLSEEGE